jgi:hypothetical protein
MTMTVRDNILVRLSDLEQKVESFAEKAAGIFSVLGYTWSPWGGAAFIPNKDQIADRLFMLIRGVRKAVIDDLKVGKGYSIHFEETGRLRVEVSHCENGEISCDMTMTALGDHEV